MALDWAGTAADVTAKVRGEDELQKLLAVTEIFPEPVPALATMLRVPAPELIVQPVGTIQLYEVAKGTESTVYKLLSVPQACAGP
jgi:hypothetical protein